MKIKQYLAKPNKIWRKIGTNELLGNLIELKDEESLYMYEQIDKPKHTSDTKKTNARRTKESEDIFSNKHND